MSSKIKRFYEFEGFRLDAENPSLWRAGKPVSIPPKALEVLILLIKHQNEIVSRDELLNTVWKDTFVEEGNINYTVSQLRKILGDKNLVQTVPRRGYRFIGTAREISENENTSADGQTIAKSADLLLPTAVETTKSRSWRWVFISLAVVCLIVPASLLFFRQNAKASRPPEKILSANPEAQQAYTRGRMILEKKNAEKRIEKAIDEFQNAATLDPTFALAYAGLAEGFASLAVAAAHPASSEYYVKARVAAEKSLALDANLAEGFMVRGWIKRSGDWDWKGAEEDLRHAVELNPKSATAHQRLAYVLCSIGKLDEALSEIKIAYDLDPVADFIASARFPILEARREYQQALKEAERFLNENKNNTFALRAYATFLYHQGEYQKVIETGENFLQKENGAKNGFAWYSLLAAAYQKNGQPEKAEESLKMLEQEAQKDTKAIYSLAMNYAELGRIDEALSILENCYEKHEERMCWLKNEPRFANLQANERFQNLLKKMNF